MKNIAFFIAIVVVSSLAPSISFGQITSGTPNQDSIPVNRLSKELQIPKDTALLVLSAMKLHQAEIDHLVRDNSVAPVLKQSQLRALIVDREEKVNSLLSPAEQGRLSIFMELKYRSKRNQFRTRIMQSKLTKLDTTKTH